MSHSVAHRLNGLLTFAVTVLAGMCALASLTDEFHVPTPTATVGVAAVERFVHIDGNDEAYLAFDVDADLRSCFTWNTKLLFVSLQVEYDFATDASAMGEGTSQEASVWDRVVESKEASLLSLRHVRNKYKLVHRGGTLRGRPAKIALQWNVMPRVGRVRSGKMAFTGFAFPEEYVGPTPRRPPPGARAEAVPTPVVAPNAERRDAGPNPPGEEAGGGSDGRRRGDEEGEL